MNYSLSATKIASRSVALALVATLGMALPAAAAPEGPPSFVQNTEQAYVMAPLTAFLGATSGAALTLRNGLPGNLEWWLQNSTVGITPFAFGTNLGGKYQWLQTPGGLASAVYADVRPAYTANAFQLGLDVGVPFSQSLIFGNLSFTPNVSLNNLTTGAAPNLNLNLALIMPLGGGWLATIQDVPSYAINGGGFSNNLSIGGRFVPANNTALDITVANLNGASNFSAGLLSVSGFVGF